MNEVKRALITGVSGQDGSYLAEFLLDLGYEVYGVTRLASRISENIAERLKKLYEVDFENSDVLSKIIINIRPDEIYHLAAYHFSSQNEGNKENSFKKFYSINLMATNEILETIRFDLPNCRFFYASSCQVFGKVNSSPQCETTPFQPDSLYSISKVAGANLCKFYREHHSIFASVGILYNHESIRRSRDFVTTLIAESAAKAFLGYPGEIQLRDTKVLADWGAAQDYVRAMWLTLQHHKGDDFIISSGVAHSVSDFAEIAFRSVGLNYKNYVFQNPNFKSESRIPYIGDNSKIVTECNWKPIITLENLVKGMVDNQILLLTRGSTV